MRIAIVHSKGAVMHTTSWVKPWTDYCEENRIEYEYVNLMGRDAVAILKNFDALLWHFGQYDLKSMLFTRSILYTAKMMGLKVFPDFNESWHFDDKVAEMYALKAVDAPIPESSVYYYYPLLERDVESGKLTLPIVAKLRTGSGSHNVKLIKSKSQLLSYGRKMLLGKGLKAAPSLIYKATSNIRSAHNKSDFMNKFHRIPEFMRTLKGAKQFPREKRYVYLQEFIPNEGYDMKVVVVGDKCSGLIRPVRSHDFRASGGGEVFFDKKYFTPEIIRSAFATTDKLGMQCIGYDYVVNKETGEGKIVEMSYGFAHTAVMASGGYFDRDCVWHEGPLNAPAEIIQNMIK